MPKDQTPSLRDLSSGCVTGGRLEAEDLGGNKIQLIKRTFEQWQQDKASRLAAALAFYAILSIPPLLILISTLVGQFAGEERVQQAIVRQVAQFTGSSGASAIQTILDAVTQPTDLSFTAFVSLAIFLFSASGVFVQLQFAMNTIWHVMPDPERGVMVLIRKRMVSFLMVLAVGVLFILLLLASSVVAFLDNVMAQILPISSLPVLRILNGVVALLVLTGVFGLIYKTLPDAEITWRDVGMGAAVTTVLFLLGILGIGTFLKYIDLTSSYGAAGSLIVLMIWIYYSTQIFFLGAEFTKVYANLYGTRIVPVEGAVRVEMVTHTYPEETAVVEPVRRKVKFLLRDPADRSKTQSGSKSKTNV